MKQVKKETVICNAIVLPPHRDLIWVLWIENSRISWISVIPVNIKSFFLFFFFSPRWEAFECRNWKTAVFFNVVSFVGIYTDGLWYKWYPGCVDFLALARLDKKIHFQRLCFFDGHCIIDGFVVQRCLASLEERNNFHYCCYFCFIYRGRCINDMAVFNVKGTWPVLNKQGIWKDQYTK